MVTSFRARLTPWLLRTRKESKRGERFPPPCENYKHKASYFDIVYSVLNHALHNMFVDTFQSHMYVYLSIDGEGGVRKFEPLTSVPTHVHASLA